MNFKLIGAPCGEHGPYVFYKAFKFTKNNTTNILALSEFFFVKLWPDSDLISIGELQLLWEDKNNEQIFASLRLYILPENTPDGRNDIHGEDEVVAISEKVVLRVEDLITWIMTDADWHWGLGALWAGESPSEQPTLSQVVTDPPLCPSSAIDMEDVIKEKHKLDKNVWERQMGVLVLSYPRYCRYRGLVKRLEGVHDSWLRTSLVVALGGFTSPFKSTRILFCKETFDYPELEGHELLCNHMAPKLKGRPRRRKKKASLSNSEESESESESSQSTSSSGTKPKVVVGGVKPRLRCTLEVSQHVPTTTPSIISPPRSTNLEKRFIAGLHSFMKSRNTPIARIPVVGFKEVNLFKLYAKVNELGGYDMVSTNKLWKHVYEVIGGDGACTSAATLSRRHYEKLLLPYERFLKGHAIKMKPTPVVIPNHTMPLPSSTRIGSIKISPIRNIRLKTEKFGEKENIPEKLRRLDGGMIGAGITIIKKEGLKEEVVEISSSDTIITKIPKGAIAVPVIKKQKLDILKEGGLEVTPIGSGGGKASGSGPVVVKPEPAPSPPESKVSITVTPDMSHLVYPWSGQSPGGLATVQSTQSNHPTVSEAVGRGAGPSQEPGAMLYGGGCAVGLPVEAVLGGAQPTPIDLRKNKPVSLGSNLEITLVPTVKRVPPLPPAPRHYPPPRPYPALPIYDPAYLCVTQRLVRPSPPNPLALYKELLRSQGMFSLLPDGSTSISIVGKTPTSK